MTFIPGMELSRRFYWEAVRPVLDRHFAGLTHSAALLGSGSETLGFDDEVSTDHGWGPRLQLFLRPDDFEAHAGRVDEALRHGLPHRFLGFPTNFSEPDPNDGGVQLLEATEDGPVNHRVDTLTIGAFWRSYLDFDIGGPIGAIDWLTFPQQKLRTITVGEVFHDEIGLGDVRARFNWYPADVWRYLLAAGWARVGQEEHLMGRAGQVGDELGSSLIASRLVRDLMRLCFLMERRYAPYAKWFGTAFGQLEGARALTKIFSAVLRAESWEGRDRYLAEAYETVAVRHNRLGLTEPMPEKATNFFGRPFKVMALHGFASALLDTIGDAEVVQFAQRRPIGSIDQFSDSTDLLEATELRTAIRTLYESE